jgi:CDP-glucose 4,6-dehydratase
MSKYGLGIYKDKKVFITGHTGFKGSWLALWLQMLGAEVLGYALEPPTNPNLFSVIGLEGMIGNVTGDIRDAEKLKTVINEFKPEIVFHLAAQPLVRYSYQKPRLTYETNIMGAINMYEAVKETSSVRAVVTITSDKCYENKEWVHGYRECDPMGGYDPYSSSKGCVELVTAAYRNSFFKDSGVALASVRAGNVIGGGDWAQDRLIPDCVRSLSDDKPIIIRNPQATRPWQFVLEPLSGYLYLGALMLQNGQQYAGAWNFGPEDSDILTVGEVVRLVIENWGSGECLCDESNQPHEASLLKLDASKAHFHLKWKPAYNIYQALEETIKWYRLFYERKNDEEIYMLTVKQIQDYVESARTEKITWSEA